MADDGPSRGSLLDRWRLLRACLADPVSRRGAPVLAVLLDYFNVQTGHARPSVATIARGAGMNERNTSSAIALLVEHGFIEASRRGGRARANEYLPRWKRMSETTGYQPLNPVGGDTLSALNPVADCSETLSISTPQPAYRTYLKAAATRVRATPLNDDDLVGFINAYPSHAGKADPSAWLANKIAPALTAALKLADIRAIIDGASNYAQSENVLEGFVKSPSRWLRERGWEEPAVELLPPERPMASSGQRSTPRDSRFMTDDERRRTLARAAERVMASEVRVGLPFGPDPKPKAPKDWTIPIDHFVRTGVWGEPTPEPGKPGCPMAPALQTEALERRRAHVSAERAKRAAGNA